MKRTYFTDIESLINQCKEVIKQNNPPEVVELWKPCYLGNDKRNRETHIEVARLDGYWDSIYFHLGNEEKAQSVYDELEHLNRGVTPLEKFHASF
jgi:hypothetical protein